MKVDVGPPLQTRSVDFHATAEVEQFQVMLKNFNYNAPFIFVFLSILIKIF